MNNIRCISRNTVKIIAVLSMMIDHFWCCFGVLFNRCDWYGTAYFILRDVIGRVAFPLFCCLFIEGFVRLSRKGTKRRLKRILLLAIVAVISEFGFDIALMYTGVSGTILEINHQNVMFSWLLGFCMLWILEILEKLRNHIKVYFVWFIQVIVIALVAFIAYELKLDYRYCCQLCLGIGYILYKNINKMKPWMLSLLVSAIIIIYNGKWACLISVPILFLYDDKKLGANWKYLYYIWYPAHLLIYGAIFTFIYFNVL